MRSQACRNFVQLCMENYYNKTKFHRVVPGFIAQGSPDDWLSVSDVTTVLVADWLSADDVTAESQSERAILPETRYAGALASPAVILAGMAAILNPEVCF